MKKALMALVLAVTLSLGLAAPAAAAGSFTDVPQDYWGAPGIQYVTQRGLFSGTSQTTFSPELAMTRAMLTQVLYSYAGKPAVSGSIARDTAYTDIPQGAYYEKAVLWALEKDILPLWFYQDSRQASDRAEEFCPDQVVNRAEFSLMLYAFYGNVLGLKYDEDQNLEGQPFADMTLEALTQAFINIGNTDEGKEVIAIYSHNGYPPAPRAASWSRRSSLPWWAGPTRKGSSAAPARAPCPRPWV